MNSPFFLFTNANLTNSYRVSMNNFSVNHTNIKRQKECPFKTFYFKFLKTF